MSASTTDLMMALEKVFKLTKINLKIEIKTKPTVTTAKGMEMSRERERERFCNRTTVIIFDETREG